MELLTLMEAHRDVFLSPGDPANIAALKALFNQAPSYGLHFRFEDYDYTVHDAARLVLLFLEELPKPLIPASVFKSWILLGKQYGAIEPSCPRVETGLDFWTEALNRLSTPARNLTKLLLTLFAVNDGACWLLVQDLDAPLKKYRS